MKRKVVSALAAAALVGIVTFQVAHIAEATCVCACFSYDFPPGATEEFDVKIDGQWEEVEVQGQEQIDGSSCSTSFSYNYTGYYGLKDCDSSSGTMYAYMPLTPQDIERRGLTDVEPHGPLPLTLTSKNVRSRDGKYSWFVPEFHDCSTPFSKGQLASPEKIRDELIKFRTPEDQESAVVKNERKGRAR